MVLHQGPLAEFRRFAGDDFSEIARRVTDFFVDPSPQEAFVGPQQRFLEDGLIHRTERGDLVHSKSELVIADKLHSQGIDYAYEQDPLPRFHDHGPRAGRHVLLGTPRIARRP